MDLKELSEKVTKDFKDKDIRARNLIKVLICGSYLGEDKKHIEDLRDELRNEFEIHGAFLMEDIISGEGIKLHQKFELIWHNINKGDNFPICIIYAGKTASESLGLNAEIQEIVKDMRKKQNTFLIKHKNVNLIHHADEIVKCYTVSNPDEFKKIAKELIERKLIEIVSFLNFMNRQRGEDSK